MKKTQQHTIDFLFSISVFFVFSAAAVVVLLLSSNIYKNVVEDSDRNFELGTTISYITEKIRQNDDRETQDIYLCEFDHCDALAISQTQNDITYTTYIYEINGSLKELFIQEGISVSAESGTTIMEIGKLEMSQLNESLLSFTCTAKNGDSVSVFVNIHSKTD